MEVDGEIKREVELLDEDARTQQNRTNKVQPTTTNPRASSGVEFHHDKKIRMRDLPTNMVVERTDKRVHELRPAGNYGLVIAQLLVIREVVMQEYLHTSSLAADAIYIGHQYQKPIRHAIEAWWRDNVASDATQSAWQRYMQAGSPGEAGRQSRSYSRSWKHQLFGKDWIFDLFVAFGDIDAEMVTCLNESCIQRAKEKEDDLKPATSRETEFKRLSDRGRAERLGYALPEVRGMTGNQSEARAARQEAREMEEELACLEAHDMRAYEAGAGNFTPNSIWRERTDVVDRAWTSALELSYAAGFSFYDRQGKWQEIAKDSIVALAVKLYFQRCHREWQTVTGWKRKYEARNAKSAPAPKRIRR
jgi:hypothetical protein